MKKLKSILINLIIFILVVIAIIAIYCFVELTILKKEYCNLFGYTYFQIETGSMSGTMEIDDIIIVKLGNENINPQDIITFREKGYLVTHRVISVDNDNVITKGDSNNIEDDPVNKNNIIGKVVYVVRDVKIWKKVFTDKKVLISLGITIILLIVVVAYKEKVGEKND